MEDCYRGSEWHKWDFHIHTPFSLLNNQFKKDKNSKLEDFDYYVKNLFQKAIENNISAIGITDYFMIEGYKKIRKDYFDNDVKLKELFNESEIKKIKSMFIFPNIEFRLNKFVGTEEKKIDYHVIFSPELSCDFIESNFLGKLEISLDNQTKYALSNNNIETIGKKVKEDNNEEGEPFEIGLKNITISEEQIQESLNQSFFKRKYMIMIPVDETVSDIKWEGRSYIE